MVSLKMIMKGTHLARMACYFELNNYQKLHVYGHSKSVIALIFG